MHCVLYNISPSLLLYKNSCCQECVTVEFLLTTLKPTQVMAKDKVMTKVDQSDDQSRSK